MLAHVIILTMKYLAMVGLTLILGSLGTALFFMLRGSATHMNKKMARALGLRVALSVLLFVCILLLWKWGYIHPTGIQAGR
jgi:hypothetical protein